MTYIQGYYSQRDRREYAMVNEPLLIHFLHRRVGMSDSAEERGHRIPGILDVAIADKPNMFML